MINEKIDEVLNEAIKVHRYVDKRGRKWERIESSEKCFRWIAMDFGTSNWNMPEDQWISTIFMKDQNR